MIGSPRNLEKEYKDKQQLQRKVIATLAYFLKIYWSIIKQSSKKKVVESYQICVQEVEGIRKGRVFFVIMTFILTASSIISKYITCTVMERANAYTRRQPEKLP